MTIMFEALGGSTEALKRRSIRAGGGSARRLPEKKD